MKLETGRLAALSVGLRLKTARDKRGLTMTQLAESAGVGTSTINQIEKGLTQPRGDTVEPSTVARWILGCFEDCFSSLRIAFLL